MAALAAVRQESTARYELAGATILSQTPDVPAVRATNKVDPAWSNLRNHLEGRLGNLRNWRNSWLQHWAVIATYLSPRRNIWLTQGATTQPSPNSMVRGRMINRAILDSTGTIAAQVCANGMMSGLTSPSRPWFKLKPALMNSGAIVDRDAQLWFDDVESRLYHVMAGSNFYATLHVMYGDLVEYGTAPMIIYEDVKQVIRCYNAVAGEYMIAVSSAMQPETLMRQFLMTVSAIVEMFGLENCPADVQELWRGKGGPLETEKIVCHAIEPNFSVASRNGQDVGNVVPSVFPWREVYWIWGSSGERPLSTRGFYDPPHVAPRWAVTSNDPYGRSPGMDALPDVMQLQLMTARQAEAIEKIVRPPLIADQTLKNQPSSILPGHITYVTQLATGNGMRPIYTVQPNLADMTANIQAIQNRIKQIFLNDLFMAILGLETVRTATDIQSRNAEKLTLVGPVIERFQNEALSPMIRRIFNIMARKGLLPPLPASLQKVPVQIEYVSPLAIAQRASSTVGIERTLGLVGSMAGVWPETKFVVDPVEAVTEYADFLSVSKKIIRSSDQVQQMMDAEMQQAQQQQQAQVALQAGQGAVDAAHTLSQTETGAGQNALQLMLGLGGAPAAGNA
jgi:hypothetical protein